MFSSVNFNLTRCSSCLFFSTIVNINQSVEQRVNDVSTDSAVSASLVYAKELNPNRSNVDGLESSGSVDDRGLGVEISTRESDSEIVNSVASRRVVFTSPVPINSMSKQAENGDNALPARFEDSSRSPSPASSRSDSPPPPPPPRETPQITNEELAHLSNKDNPNASSPGFIPANPLDGEIKEKDLRTPPPSPVLIINHHQSIPVWAVGSKANNLRGKGVLWV